MCRNWCYDVGLFQSVIVNVPVLSVGNITTGGTGKTPFVEYLIRYCLNQKSKVAVLSRGYKRTTIGTNIVSDGMDINGTTETMGDEPFQIAMKFPGIIVVVDEDRARAARMVVDKWKPDVILLDDGFQHRGIVRDLDIVIIDGTKPLLKIPMLPAGLRREPFSSLRRADLLVLSRNYGSFSTIESVIQKYTKKPLVTVQFKPRRLYEIFANKDIPLSKTGQKSCVAFCGIGNPDSFKETLNEMGFAIKDLIVFPDHHRYNEIDIQEIQRVYKECKAEYIITTEKDAVRLRSINMPESFQFTALFCVEIEAVITKGEKILHDLLQQKLQRAA